MKGLNIKRIAALGLGAALVGSALAPAVMAGVFSNVDTLQKTNVIDSTGTPVVDIVVGSMGHASDVVWAGNIAAKVAQLATVDATAAAPTVDFTVGGTTSIIGAGNLADSNVTATPSEFNPISATSTDMPTLVNDASWKYKYDGTDTTIVVSESLDSNVGLTYQDSVSSTAYGAGEMLATVAKGALQYTLDLGDGFPAVNGTNLDANSAVNITIPILGKTYVVDEIASSGKDLVLFSQTNPTTLNIKESLNVTSKTGKAYTVVLSDITKNADGADYQASFDLVDGTTVVDSKSSVVSGDNLKSVFGDIFDDSVYVSFVGQSIVSGGSAYVTIRTGSSRLEIKDNAAFPYTGDTEIDKKAALEATITVVSPKVTKIVLSNKPAYSRVSGSENDSSKFALKVGGSVAVGTDFGKLEFVGLETKTMHEIQIGNDLTYIDYKGTKITVPLMVNNLGIDLNISNGISPVYDSDLDYTFWLGTGTGSNDAKLYYIKGDKSDVTDPVASSLTTSTADLNYRVPTSGTNLVSLDLGAYTRPGTKDTIDYAFVTNNDGSKQALLLAAQAFDVFDKSNVTGELKFLGTDTSESGVVAKTYYVPDTKEVDINTLTLDDSDKAYMVAHFELSETAEFDASSGLDTNLFVLTGDTAKVLDVESLGSTDLDYYSRDATNETWTDSIRQGVDYLQTGATPYGTEISSDGASFTIMLPEEIRKAQVYLGGVNATSGNTGGKEYTGVAVDGTEGNVTITGINGTAGKTVVKVGNIVKLDTDAVSGKSIIVGGYVVNNMAANLQVGGQTLQERLVASGDYVAAVLDNGNVVVAGWTKEDTAVAARALIAQLDSFM